jgi:hypothetical protein
MFPITQKNVSMQLTSARIIINFAFKSHIHSRAAASERKTIFIGADIMTNQTFTAIAMQCKNERVLFVVSLACHSSSQRDNYAQKGDFAHSFLT